MVGVTRAGLNGGPHPEVVKQSLGTRPALLIADYSFSYGSAKGGS